jgi:putative peptidoglycan lipid II flippase
VGRPKTPAALAVALGIFLSRIAGLLRDRVFAHYLGNSVAAGAFKAALRIPNFLQNLFGEGVLSASFIPVYARLRAEGHDQEARQLAGSVATILILSVTILSAVGVLFAPFMIDVLAPGFDAPEVRILTVNLVRIMFPGIALLVMSAWCLGILNSHGHFLLSYVAPVLWNMAIITALIWSGVNSDGDAQSQNRLVVNVAWGTVIGCFLQLGVQLPLVIKLVKGTKFKLGLESSAVRKVIKNFLPVLGSRGVVQVSAYIDGIIASFLGPAVYSAMAYAQTLYLLPISLFGMSVSAAELPAMSSVIGNQELIHQQVQEKLARGLSRVAYFVIPSAAAMLVLGDVIIATVYQTGVFTPKDAQDGWLILGGYAIGLLPSTLGRLCSTAFYATGDSRTPLKYACLRVALTASLGALAALVLRQALGLSLVAGAALLTSAAGISSWLEYLLLKRAIGNVVGSVKIPATLLTGLVITALVSAGLGFGVKNMTPKLNPVISGICVLGVFGVGYLALTAWLGLGEGKKVRNVLAKHLN